MKVIIKPSTNKDKKLMAVFYNDARADDKPVRTTHFGQKGADDYTLTGDKKARDRYRTRHKKDLLTKDPMRAGYLARFILWGDSTSLQKNIKDYKKMFGFN